VQKVIHFIYTHQNHTPFHPYDLQWFRASETANKSIEIDR